MFCRYCGSFSGNGSKFCNSCGKKLGVHSVVNLEDEISEGRENLSNTGTTLNQEELLRLFVGGKKEDYYIHKWSKGDRSWNWAAFFLSTFWLGYRKMFKPLFVMFGIFLVLDIVFILSGIDSTSFDNAIGVVVSITLGVWGNYLYRRHAVKNINLLTENNRNHEELYREIEMRGGSSWKGVLGVVGIIIIYIVLSMLIFTFVPTINNSSEINQEKVKATSLQAASKEDITKDIEEEITDLLHENIQTLENENLDEYLLTVFKADNPSVHLQTQEVLDNIFESHDLSYEIKDIKFLSVRNSEVRVRLTQTTTWKKGDHFRDNESIFIHTLKPQEGKWKFFESEIESVNYLDGEYLTYADQNFNSNASATLHAPGLFDFFVTENIDVNNDGTLETVSFRGGPAQENRYTNGNVEIIVEFSDGSSTSIYVIADNIPVLYLYDIDQDGWMNLFYESGYRLISVDMYEFTRNGLEYDSTLRGSVEKFNPHEVITNEGTYGFD